MRMLTKILLVLCLCGISAGANDFSGDANCKALWRLEDGALTTDSKGGNTLAAYATPTANTTTFKEGAASCDFDAGDGLYIGDGDTDTGFPFRSADGGGRIMNLSLAAWVYSDGISGYQTIFAQAQASATFWIRINPSGILEFYVYVAGWEHGDFGTAMSATTWYHVGVTYQDSDNSYRIRVWDDTAGDYLGADVTGSFSGSPQITGQRYTVGSEAFATSNWIGLLDEVVVFNDVLTTDEIDQIRAGTFGAGGGGGGGQVIIIEMD